MGDRTVPFDDKAICDICGKIGAYDFMGDLLCPECTKGIVQDDSPCDKCDISNDCTKCPIYGGDKYVSHRNRPGNQRGAGDTG